MKTAVSGVLALVGLAPIAGAAPAVPTESPTLWAMLAWVRRQYGQTDSGQLSQSSRAATLTSQATTETQSSQSFSTFAAAAAVNTAPTANPTQSAPNQTTGAITGAINGADVDGNTLSYTVTGTAPASGSVTVNATTGAFTYTPTQAARLAAGQTTAADFDSFTVSVSDGQTATTTSVSVPVLPAVVSSVTTKQVGTNPLGVAVSATKSYVANSASNTVSVVDRTSGAVTTINVVATPTAIALSADGTRAYVAGNNGVSVINTATNTVVGSYTTGGGQAYAIAVSPNGQRVYVAMAGTNKVAVLNTTSTTPTLVATVAVGSVPVGIAVSADGTRVYVTNYGSSNMSVINTATNTVIKTISTGANPEGVAVSPDGSRVYVANLGSSNVTVINPTATTTTVATVAVGANPFGLTISPDGSLVYTANGPDTVSVINTKTNAVVTTFSIDSAPSNNWHGIAVSPDGNQIYVGDMSNAALRSVTLNRGNTAPIAGTPTVGAPSNTDGAVTGTLNFRDVDGDTLTYSVPSQPSSGNVVVTEAGGFTYTPTTAARNAAAQTPGTDTATFNVTANDGTATSTVSVTVTISPLVANRPPVAGTPSVGTPDRGTGTVTGALNFTDPDGNPLTYSVPTQPSSGTVTVTGGNYTFTPNQAARDAANTAQGAKTASITVVASDGQASTPVTFTVPIKGTNRAPTPGTPAVGTPDTTTGAVSGALNFTDPDSDPLTFSVTQPSTGTVTFSGNTYTFTPTKAARDAAATPNGAKNQTITVTASDGLATGSVTFNAPISPTPPPTASPTQSSPNQATGVVTGAINGTGVVGSTLTYTLTGTAPASGSVTVNAATGAFTYTPTQAARLAAGQTAAADFDSLTVTVSDGPATTPVTVSVPVLPAVVSSVTTKQVGVNPLGVAVSATKAYVANSAGNSVSVVDRTSGAVTTISVVATPTAIALSADGTRAYVAGNNGVSVINTATNTVVGSYTTGGGQSYGIAVSPNGQRVYVTMTGTNRVAVLNTVNTTPTLVTTIAVGGTPAGVAVSADGTRAYVTNYGSNTMSVIDTSTNAVVKTISTGGNPIGVAISPDGTRVYVSNLGSNNVTVINPTATTTTVATITVGANPFGLALSPDGSLLYAANGIDTVSAINTMTNAVTTTFSIDSAPSNNWHGIAVSPDGNQIYVGDMSNAALRSVTLNRGNTAPVVGTPTVGSPSGSNGAVTGTLNFNDVDGDTLTYNVPSQPSSGNVVVTAAGGFTYTPTTAARNAAAQTPGTDTATFNVTANDGTVASTVAVTVTISPLAASNNPPVAGTPSVGTPDRGSGTVTGALNFTDPDGNPLTYSVPTQPSSGTVTVTGGNYTFTPTQAARDAANTAQGAKTASITAVASDGQASTPVTFTVPIKGTNRAPTPGTPAVGTPDTTTGAVSGAL
ncbi:MAG: large repetitive protein, partial [Mycobacterium sp.]|nr:large repetitive protein [Mycobacterium sp.]